MVYVAFKSPSLVKVSFITLSVPAKHAPVYSEAIEAAAEGT